MHQEMEVIDNKHVSVGSKNHDLTETKKERIRSDLILISFTRNSI